MIPDLFLDWKEGSMHALSYGTRRKLPNKQAYQWGPWIRRLVHRQNARIIQQLVYEVDHGKHDRGHESLRRAAYAEAVLHAVGRELDSDDDDTGPIRAAPLKALTPILVRQMRGTPDAYGPSIRAAIAPGKDLPTIADITDFYLGRNPLDSKYIRVYRRNIIYSREALWHLGCLLKTVDVTSREDYLTSLEVHDLIMESLKNEEAPTATGIPLFSEFEVHAIIRLHLEGFFARELKRIVSLIPNHSPQFLIISIASCR